MYPILTIEDMLDHLAGDHYFTKLNIELGYHQFYMNTIDTWKTYLKLILVFLNGWLLAIWLDGLTLMLIKGSVDVSSDDEYGIVG